MKRSCIPAILMGSALYCAAQPHLSSLALQGGASLGALYSLPRGEERYPFLFGALLGASIATAGKSAWEIVLLSPSSRALPTWAATGTLAAATTFLQGFALLDQEDRLGRALWGDSSEVPGPLLNLSNNLGEDGIEKLGSLAIFALGSALPLALHHWLLPNPTLAAVSGIAIASIPRLRDARHGRQRSQEEWSRSGSVPLMLGVVTASTLLAMDSLAPRLTSWVINGSPHLGVEQILQSSVVIMGTLSIATQTLRASRNYPWYQKPLHFES